MRQYIGYRCTGAGEGELDRGEIVQPAGTGHAPCRRSDPPGDRSLIGAHDETTVPRQIEEVETVAFGTDETIAGADHTQILLHARVSRQNEVIAVIDNPVDFAVMIGSATPTSLSRGLVNDNA